MSLHSLTTDKSEHPLRYCTISREVWGVNVGLERLGKFCWPLTSWQKGSHLPWERGRLPWLLCAHQAHFRGLLPCIWGSWSHCALSGFGCRDLLPCTHFRSTFLCPRTGGNVVRLPTILLRSREVREVTSFSRLQNDLELERWPLHGPRKNEATRKARLGSKLRNSSTEEGLQ